MIAALLVFIAVLVSPASASAECAWVLWGSVISVDGQGPWEPADAYDTRDKCAAQIIRDEKRFEKAQYKGAHILVLQKCLPDTVDLRRPR